MNEKHTYSGDRTKNHFTAYLLEFIKGRRSSYLDKKIRTEKDSFLMEEIAEIEERGRTRSGNGFCSKRLQVSSRSGMNSRMKNL